MLFFLVSSASLRHSAVKLLIYRLAKVCCGASVADCVR